jgi:sodium/bile acid cotransporter 7
MPLKSFIKENWFLLGLLVVSSTTLGDFTESTAGLGRWLKDHHGTDFTLWAVFFFSGLGLNSRRIREGLGDIKGTMITLVIIFVAAPACAFLFAFLPLDAGVRIGLFLVAVMPTTISSGVVMTGAAGGNMAHSLLITILANGLSLFSVPFSLELLVGSGISSIPITIDKAAMMIKIGFLVLVPLFMGFFIRFFYRSSLPGLERGIPFINQCLVLAMVWMALSGARATVLEGGVQLGAVLLLAFFFHAFLLGAAFSSSVLFDIGPGRRESIIFMGGQKTLPLSLLLQVNLFPQYGLALAFCVAHHFVHLMMDGYIVGRLSGTSGKKSE